MALPNLARGYFDSILTLEQTGALFFVLAFGMIVRWRLSLFLSYRALTSTVPPLDGALEEASN